MTDYLQIVTYEDDTKLSFRSSRNLLSGSGPTGGDSMEERMARLEVDMEYVRRDTNETRITQRDLPTKADIKVTKWHIIMFLIGAIGILATVVVLLFNSMTGRVDLLADNLGARTDLAVERLAGRMNLIEAKIDAISEQLSMALQGSLTSSERPPK